MEASRASQCTWRSDRNNRTGPETHRRSAAPSVRPSGWPCVPAPPRLPLSRLMNGYPGTNEKTRVKHSRRLFRLCVPCHPRVAHTGPKPFIRFPTGVAGRRVRGQPLTRECGWDNSRGYAPRPGASSPRSCPHPDVSIKLVEHKCDQIEGAALASF